MQDLETTFLSITLGTGSHSCTIRCPHHDLQLSSWNPTNRLQGFSVYFQLAHLMVSVVAVALSATRQLVSNINSFVKVPMHAELRLQACEPADRTDAAASFTGSESDGGSAPSRCPPTRTQGHSRALVPQTAVDRVARAGPVACLVLIFVDVLLRVLRMSVYLSAGHLSALSASIPGAALLTSLFILGPSDEARRRAEGTGTLAALTGNWTDSDPNGQDSDWSVGGESDRQMQLTPNASGCHAGRGGLPDKRSRWLTVNTILVVLMNPFMLLLSPWCMFAALAFRPLFTGALYILLFVFDTIGMTALYAAPMFGYIPFHLCPVDVFGTCAVDIVPSSCFPKGFIISFVAVWAASVVLWLWAGVVMIVGSSGREA